MSTPPVRTVIVDDHVVVRIGLRLLLEAAGGFTILGEATDAAGAISTCTQLQPDLVILDLQMAGRPDDGLHAITELTRTLPTARILVLTQHTDEGALFAALHAGAHGFCAKHEVQDRLIRAATAVAAGEAHFGAAVAANALQLITAQHAVRIPMPDLTTRQREILHLMAAGLGDTAIAARLGIHKKTVQNHITAILAHLQVVNRSDAAAKARAAGLGGPTSKQHRINRR